MRNKNTFYLPEDISDEAAYELYEVLEELFMAVEERYRYRIRRHLQSYTRVREVDASWEDDDIEF
jgi:hypothetical protein